MNKLNMAIGLVFITVTVPGCKNDGPQTPDIPERITLTMIDAAVKETYLHIAASNPASNETLALLRNGTTVMTFAAVADTNIADTALTQTTTYQYTATLQTANTTTGKSNTLAVQTLAPTSHDWHFTIDSLGVQTSTLYDVAVINDTLAYAVGEIYLRDSTGQVDPQAYNMARWNGRQWQMLRIQFYTICGQSSRTPYPAKSVFAFGANDVWIAMNGDQVARWNGSAQTSTMCLPVSFSISKLWGENPNSVFAVGASGNIMHYTGATWQRVESGTTVDLLDVWGSPDGSVVWACGYDQHGPSTFLLRGSQTTWSIAYDGTASRVQIRSDSISGALTSVYTPSSSVIFVGSSSGVYLAPQATRGEAKRLSFTPTFFPGFPNKLRGNDLNDLVIVGDYCFIAHYSGMSWRDYENLRSDNIRLWSVAQLGNQMFCVGQTLDPFYRRGIIVRGIR